MTLRAEGEKGSVLIDALVAVSVLTLTLAFCAQAVGAGARRTRAAETSRYAVLEARSRLAEVGGDLPLALGVVSGEDAGLHWAVDVEPAADAQDAAGPGLLAVTATVRDGEGRVLARLQSLRLARTG